MDLSKYNPQEKLNNMEADVVAKESFPHLTEEEQENMRGYAGAELFALFQERHERGQVLSDILRQ